MSRHQPFSSCTCDRGVVLAVVEKQPVTHKGIVTAVRKCHKTHRDLSTSLYAYIRYTLSSRRLSIVRSSLWKCAGSYICMFHHTPTTLRHSALSDCNWQLSALTASNYQSSSPIFLLRNCSLRYVTTGRDCNLCWVDVLTALSSVPWPSCAYTGRLGTISHKKGSYKILC